MFMYDLKDKVGAVQMSEISADHTREEKYVTQKTQGKL
jgi:hypothetical protein